VLAMKARRPPSRTLRGWAISELQEAHAIRECEERGWTHDPADPPQGLSAREVKNAIKDVLDGIGDTCSECPPR
jgi:hypothetical protein